MQPKRYIEEHIISILKEHETGMSIIDLERKYGVSFSSQISDRPIAQ